MLFWHKDVWFQKQSSKTSESEYFIDSDYIPDLSQGDDLSDNVLRSQQVCVHVSIVHTCGEGHWPDTDSTCVSHKLPSSCVICHHPH